MPARWMRLPPRLCHRNNQMISASDRARRLGHRSAVIWLTGLSAAGKTTLAESVESALSDSGYLVCVLDGDTIRAGLSADLGFTADARAEQVRRVAHVARLLSGSGLLCVVSLISPYRSDRNLARAIVGPDFHEVYVRASLDTCERRDPKGLYRRARRGEIQNFTGISDPYEEPVHPELIVDTEKYDRTEASRALTTYIYRITTLPDDVVTSRGEADCHHQ